MSHSGWAGMNNFCPNEARNPLPKRNYDLRPPPPALPLRQIVLQTSTRNAACIFDRKAAGIKADYYGTKLKRRFSI